ncbi:MAG: Fic family protein, partial [Sphingobacteriales bacterium]
YLSRQDVISSIRNNLGLNPTLLNVRDKKAKGIGTLMVDVRSSYAEPLTIEKLFKWHEMLLGHEKNLTVGAWRSDQAPMQVVSGAYGKEKIHFEAPPSASLAKEMKQFIAWFNATGPGGKKEIKKAPLRSAIAHLYFESIHPFEDGNGRIGRAIAEKALSQTVGRPILLSLSRTIEADKKAYYNALETAQRSNDITSWVAYFVKTTLAAQLQAEQLIDYILKKTKYFDKFRGAFNDRQLKVIQEMLDAGPDGFVGGMSAQKYISIVKTSKATATRDLQLLTEMGAIKPIGGGGRSTRYELNLALAGL